MAFHTLNDLSIGEGDIKTALVRVDFNVPVINGTIQDNTRLLRAKRTISELQKKGFKVVLISHFGRPKGRALSEFSFLPFIETISETLETPVEFAADCVGPIAQAAVASLGKGEVLLLENLRFHVGEEANDQDFARALAGLADVYVNDAFSASHRAHASIVGVCAFLPVFAGRALQKELDTLHQALAAPARPLVALVGGAKVSSKINLLNNLVAKVDALVIGGGMANSFLAALGKKVGKSLCEHNLGDTVRAIMARAKAANCSLILPVDAAVGYHFEAHAPYQYYAVDAIPTDGMILDVGDQSIERIKAAIDDAATLIWNGPLGAFELHPFDKATVSCAKRAADRTKEGKLVSVAGGGDTVSALNHAGVANDFTYLSTAGGAFLEWMEGKTLPGIAVLERAEP
ncbi:phosphoglycerate kinase [Bartonella sp. DGB2]|uniref:phosphoglycerate kinase n=1 Tax=Bartonella sp. DGB2 TaxID=3388426 RepID=UPI00398FDD14